VRLLDQLCAAGIVRREADPTDRRANALWLTATGKELAEKIEAKLAQLRASVFAGINKQDFEAALLILGALSLAASSASSTTNTGPADQADSTMTESMISP
jgi:MarR family transcriptional regulator for hemolysin